MITSEMSRDDEGEATNMPQQPYYQFKIIQINRLRKISSQLSLKLNIWTCMNARRQKAHQKNSHVASLSIVTLTHNSNGSNDWRGREMHTKHSIKRGEKHKERFDL